VGLRVPSVFALVRRRGARQRSVMSHLFDLYDSTIMHRALIEAALVVRCAARSGGTVLLCRLPFFTIHRLTRPRFRGGTRRDTGRQACLRGAIVFALAFVIGIWVTGVEERLATSTVVGVGARGFVRIGAMLGSRPRTVSPTTLRRSSSVRSSRATRRSSSRPPSSGLLVLAHDDRHAQGVGAVGIRSDRGTSAGPTPRTVDLLALLIVAAAVVTTVPSVHHPLGGIAHDSRDDGAAS